MKILALDLGSTLGYASGINEKITKHDYKSFGRKGWFSNESFAAFFNWLHPLAGKVDIIVCEKPNSHMPSFHALRVLFGMYGVVQACAGGWQKSLIPVGATEVKKFWAGHGHASKEQMLVKAAERGFASIKDHNQCDAVAIYLFYWEVLRGKPLQDDSEEQLPLAG